MHSPSPSSPLDPISSHRSNYFLGAPLTPPSLSIVLSLTVSFILVLIYTRRSARTTMAADSSIESKPEDFSGSLNVSQKLPSKAELTKIASSPILNSKGESIPFSSLWSSKRTMVIFIRHFFCGNCQEYLRTLCEAVSPSEVDQISPAINLVIIGCGSPELIDFYRQETNCTFPIYTDPDRKLFKALGMTRTKQPGSRPKYQQRSLFSISMESILQGLGRGRNALKGGDFWQVGGEFLVEDGECLWVHRMATTRDHSEVPEIRRVMGLDGGVTPMRKTSSVMDGVKRRWSRQYTEGMVPPVKRSVSPPSKIEEDVGPRDSGVEIDA